MGVKLWLVRHGETEWSLSGAHTSTTDIPLTDHGRKRAEELRDYLKNTSFAKVFVSPAQRAQETCQIAGFGKQAVTVDNLREWDYGEAEGKTTKDMREQYGPTWSVWNSHLRGGESVQEVGQRADAVIRQASEQARDGENVALFAHAHILRILAARWINLNASSAQHFALGTGSVSVLGWERENAAIVHWNRGFEE